MTSKKFSYYSKMGQIQGLRIDGYDKFKVIQSNVQNCSKFTFELFIPEVKITSRQRDVLGNTFYMETMERSKLDPIKLFIAILYQRKLKVHTKNLHCYTITYDTHCNMHCAIDCNGLCKGIFYERSKFVCQILCILFSKKCRLKTGTTLN